MRFNYRIPFLTVLACAGLFAVTVQHILSRASLGSKIRPQWAPFSQLLDYRRSVHTHQGVLVNRGERLHPATRVGWNQDMLMQRWSTWPALVPAVLATIFTYRFL